MCLTHEGRLVILIIYLNLTNTQNTSFFHCFRSFPLSISPQPIPTPTITMRATTTNVSGEVLSMILFKKCYIAGGSVDRSGGCTICVR
ncbi:hypothetical protein Hanom_Chr11g01058191 [Helianthus anomalus]